MGKEEFWQDCEKILEEMIESQRGKLLQYARKIVPHATSDDVLQPMDFPELEEHPLFRYEEGVFEGLHTAITALRAHKAEEE